MDYRCMLVGSYLKSVEFGQGDIPQHQPTFKIVNVALEKLESIAMNDTDGSSAKLKTKGVIFFEGLERAWILNRTNAECMAALFGRETNEWIGKRVTLLAADVRVGAKMDKGIRVKGSPDISKEITVSVKLPRRKPVIMKLVPTGGGGLAEADESALAGSATVEALKQAWTKFTPEVQASDAAKQAYKSNLARVRSAGAALPPPE